ncbi:MAG: glycoside hydrolase family 99-like domain-containing protein, partial [Armatimonadota bacterium]
MKLPVLMIVVYTLTAYAARVMGAEGAALEWDFSKATSTLGWTQAEPIKEFKVEGSALFAVAGPGRPKLTSPLFELEATPWQYVEVELKTDADGRALMFYSNTTGEPYGGFRPQLHVSFDVIGDNQWHTYTIRPFWQKQGKIIHIRLDPPGEKVAVRAVRIVDIKPGEGSKEAAWHFKNADAGWRVIGGTGKIEATSEGLKITGDQNTCVLSPPLALDPEQAAWVMVRARSDRPQVAMFRWAREDADGLHAAPVPLKGDGIVHTCALDLGIYPAWAGKVVAVGITPTDAVEARSIVVESVALGDKPTGPAYIDIAWFGLDYPIVRIGQKAKLVAEVKNTGGSDARSLVAKVTLVDEQTQRRIELTARKTGVVAPGEKVRFEWEIDAKDETQRLAICRVTGPGLDAVEKSFSLKFWPKVETSGLKYVPRPAKADTGDYLVGCYYYPGWHTYQRWSVLEDYPERKPVLGWYREGEPEIADWHIKWALEHGIGFFIYDWYWDRGRRQLEHALHDGFLKSRYGKLMKFCLLWANHNPEKTSSEQDCLEVTRFWIDNY